MIVLPAEVLTPQGWRAIETITNHDYICIYQTSTNSFTFENPLEIYHQNLYFSCNEIDTQHVTFLLDESHSKKFLETQAPAGDTNAYNLATQYLKAHFKNPQKDMYTPSFKGIFKTTDFAEACRAQTQCLFAGYRCNLECFFNEYVCSIVDENEVVCIGPQKFVSPQPAINIATSTGYYVVRICTSHIGKCVYSTFII